MKTSVASRLAGAILVVTGILGILLLATDQILRESMGGQHYYGLMVFVLIDLVSAGYVLAKPSKMSFTLAVLWCAVRILIQIADVFFGPQMGLSYGEFANYLFNPALATAPNPPGIPGAVIDIIVILELIVIGVGVAGRSSVAQSK